MRRSRTSQEFAALLDKRRHDARAHFSPMRVSVRAPPSLRDAARSFGLVLRLWAMPPMPLRVMPECRRMGGGESDGWAARLAESKEQLAELRDSPDPVAQRQITEALYSMGKALSKLSRSAEAVDVWDELLLRLAVEPSSRSQRMALRVLSNKTIDLGRLDKPAEAVQTADALLILSDSVDPPEAVRWHVLIALLVKLSAVAGARAEAAAINGDIVRRLSDAEEPMIHEQVTAAYVRLGLLRLLADCPGETIEMSFDLADRFESAPDEALAEEADLLNVYGRCLVGVAGTGWRGVAGLAAFLSVSVAIWLGYSVLERLGRPIGKHASGPRVMPTRWKLARRRIDAAIQLQERTTSRIESSSDPALQRAATISRMQAASARIVLGDITRGWRELSPILDSSDPASVQALQTLAANLRGRSDLAGQLDELLLLSLRAEALGGGDVKIQQIAYEDSIEPLLAGTSHRSVRWVAALMTPGLLPEAFVKAKTAVLSVAYRFYGKSEKG